MLSRRYSPWIRWGALNLGLVAFGCGGEESSTDDKACDTSLDCASGQVCRMDLKPQTKMIAPPMCLLQTACTTSAQCSGGNVCAPNVQPNFGSVLCPPMVCSSPCQTGSCRADEVCGVSGLCEFQPCDQVGAPACTEHYRCDLVAAAAAAAAVAPADFSGSSVGDTDDPTRAAKRGCVRKRCDESAGFVCRDYWKCSPDVATSASGCVPVPCTETGHCSSDDAYVCSATNAGHRPSGTDANGCVVRNCGEGKACQYLRNGVNYSYCDLENPTGNEQGCVVRQCDEDGAACSATQRCAPQDRFADDLGCRPLNCSEGATCPMGYVCDPASPSSGSTGCVSPGAGGSGAGGSANAGTGGTATSGKATGGAATSGAGSTEPDKRGTCVASG